LATSIYTRDVLIVGAGASGLYLIHKLRALGLSVRVFEAGSDVGGTWYWNRYPGCRCDVESLEYSFSFSDDLQQQWRWSDRYATQAQILEYMNHVADRFELRRDIQFNTRVVSAQFDSSNTLWTLRTDSGEHWTAPYCVMATGNLSTPQMPDIDGLDDFTGDCYHTGLWPHEGVDFSGQRVGLIGTGSSGVQSIPHVARQAKHLTVFQRTANFILPARNRPTTDEEDSTHKARYTEHRAAAFDTPFGIAGHPPPEHYAMDVSASDRTDAYQRSWQRGGQIAFLYTYKDLLVSEAANETAAEFVRERIRETVKDPATAVLLCPDSHPIGTKRLILDTNYFETYNRDNVSLVDLRPAPITGFSKTGLNTGNASYELDAVIFATGFDAMTGALREIDIRGVDGQLLADHWLAGPRTYLGLMSAGFPNLFMITGPQSPGVKSNMLVSIQQHVDWIAGCLEHARALGYSRVEAPKAASWYMGANIPGKTRIFMPYVGGVDVYTKRLKSVIDNGYEGFLMS